MFKIQVPATSANIGGGFDCMGIAIELYNEIYIRENSEFKIDTDADIAKTPNNLVYKTFVKTLQEIAKKQEGKIVHPLALCCMKNPEHPLPVYIKQVNCIPKTSGLGSSAACIVGGMLAANAMTGNPLSRQELVNLCAKIEGHPDNVLPCLLGGLVGAVMEEDGSVHYLKQFVNKDIRFCFYTPAFSLETKQSRKVLPSSYPVSDFVYSMSRAVLTFSALASGDVRLIKNVVGDKIHQPYRSVLIPDYDSVAELNLECGALATYLSGAGPTIAAIVTDKFCGDRMREKLSFLPNNWKMLECAVSRAGAKVERV